MKTKLTWLKSIALKLAVVWLPGVCAASTFVSGNVSGTWTKTGSPYIATGNLTVPSGLTLSIQPGVTIIIGQGLNMDVKGAILAVGTAAERIIIRGASPSLYWDKISINYTAAPDSSFVNCDINDATNALYLYAYNTGAQALAPQISNCQFSNCVQACIYGYSSAPNNIYGVAQSRLNPVIRNTLFQGASVGIYCVADGRTGYGSYPGQGSINPTIANCHFSSISDAGVWMEAVTAAYAPFTSTPDIENSIFLQCATAIRRSGIQTMFQNDNAAYNCLFNNQTNFAGYPAGVYGTICCVNARGTNCDLANNIFENPLFAETVNYTLAGNSPCIDAGNPDGAYLDSIPPSQGTTVNDIGIWGGPHAFNWLTNATTSFTLTTARYIGVTINPASAGTYRLEYTGDLTNGLWTQATNVSLLSTPWTYIDFNSPTNARRFYRAVLLLP